MGFTLDRGRNSDLIVMRSPVGLDPGLLIRHAGHHRVRLPHILFPPYSRTPGTTTCALLDLAVGPGRGRDRCAFRHRPVTWSAMSRAEPEMWCRPRWSCRVAIAMCESAPGRGGDLFFGRRHSLPGNRHSRRPSCLPGRTIPINIAPRCRHQGAFPRAIRRRRHFGQRCLRQTGLEIKVIHTARRAVVRGLPWRAFTGGHGIDCGQDNGLAGAAGATLGMGRRRVEARAVRLRFAAGPDTIGALRSPACARRTGRRAGHRRSDLLVLGLLDPAAFRSGRDRD